MARRRPLPALVAFALAVGAGAVVFAGSTPSSAAPPDGAGGGGPEVSPAQHHDVSPPLRSMPSKPWNNAAQVREHPPISPAGATTPRPDGALQAAATSPAAATTSGGSSAGVGDGDYGFAVTSAPPDTTGAVGATQYVQWVNQSFAVFDKSTKAIVSGFPKQGNTLWSGFGGGCEANNDGDPVVAYDKAANRWVLSQFSVTSPATYGYLECVAVSTTSDATGTYSRYAFSYGSKQFNDYPKLGVWPDGYYLTYNIFNSGRTFAGAKACSFDRAAMLAGAAANQICFQLSTSYGNLLPTDLDGATAPPAGAPNVFASFGANTLNLWKFHADFATPANSTFTGPAVLAVAAFSEACSGGACVVQPGTSQKLDSLADRLMYRLAYRNFGDHQSWVVTHSVTAGTSTGVRWYELRDLAGSPTVYQQGTYAPDPSYRWMASAAMDSTGAIAVGYSVSSGTQYPSIAYATWSPGETLGTLTAETVVKQGAGSQLPTLARWGDYSTMTVDPGDDCTFWYSTEYLKKSGTFNWSTWISSFKLTGCGATSTAVPGAPTLTATAGNASVALSWSTPSGSPTSYTVYRRTASTTSAVLQPGVTGTTFTDTAVTNGTTYYYTVTATNTVGEGPHSNEVSATPAAPAPAPPVAAFVYSCSGATCSFDASSSTNADSYAWAFGDTATGTGVTTSHTYAGKGSYTVTLTATSSTSSGSSTATKTISCTARGKKVTCQ